MKKLLVGVIASSNVIALSLAAAGPLAAFAPLSERTHTKVSGDLVNVSVDFGDDFYDVPLNALNHALASYPQCRQFRLTWTEGELEIFHDYTALYDRRKHSVTIYGTSIEGDRDGRTSFGGHFRYTKVQEKDFQKIAATLKHIASNGGDVTPWFDYLTRYGCRWHTLPGGNSND